MLYTDESIRQSWSMAASDVLTFAALCGNDITNGVLGSPGVAALLYNMNSRRESNAFRLFALFQDQRGRAKARLLTEHRLLTEAVQASERFYTGQTLDESGFALLRLVAEGHDDLLPLSATLLVCQGAWPSSSLAVLRNQILWLSTGETIVTALRARLKDAPSKAQLKALRCALPSLHGSARQRWYHLLGQSGPVEELSASLCEEARPKLERRAVTPLSRGVSNAPIPVFPNCMSMETKAKRELVLDIMGLDHSLAASVEDEEEVAQWAWFGRVWLLNLVAMRLPGFELQRAELLATVGMLAKLHTTEDLLGTLEGKLGRWEDVGCAAGRGRDVSLQARLKLAGALPFLPAEAARPPEYEPDLATFTLKMVLDKAKGFLVDVCRTLLLPAPPPERCMDGPLLQHLLALCRVCQRQRCFDHFSSLFNTFTQSHPFSFPFSLPCLHKLAKASCGPHQPGGHVCRVVGPVQ